MTTTGPALETRRLLVEAATEAFAEHGVFAASLVDITRRAGQRNRGAVHYHFGTREGLLVAVLEQYADFPPGARASCSPSRAPGPTTTSSRSSRRSSGRPPRSRRPAPSAATTWSSSDS
jgi:AcrR family transcriptional regulator